MTRRSRRPNRFETHTRPTGSYVSLLDDPQRFTIAAWFMLGSICVLNLASAFIQYADRGKSSIILTDNAAQLDD